jgi:hypothetical protein
MNCISILYAYLLSVSAQINLIRQAPWSTATRVGAPGGLYANPYMIVSLEDYVITVYSKAYMLEALFGEAFFGAVTCDPPFQSKLG